MDGLLIVDKPSGPTSHDIVSRARRVLKERRIGHTGTLDPLASGVLPLVIGRATRLARFIGGDKAYDATIRLGVNTDTYDVLGEPIGEAFKGAWPDRDTIDAALVPFRGTFLQQPPAFSAKKVAGQRSYALARKAKTAASGAACVEDDSGEQEHDTPAPLPEPVPVTAYAVDLLEARHELVRVHVRCSAGFYIRSLAFDLGRTLGTGAHLLELRRTEAAGFGLEQAIPLDRMLADDGAQAAAAAIIPMERMLGLLPVVSLTDDGVARVRVGRDLGPDDATGGFADAVNASRAASPVAVRLFGPSGDLVAMAEAAATPGLLHPAVVLL